MSSRFLLASISALLVASPAPAAPRGTTQNLPVRRGAPLQPRPQAANRLATGRSRELTQQTAYCTQSNGFVGNSSDYKNVAYEYISAVVTGDDNQACSAGSIEGGEFNVLNADESDDGSGFIGGGKSNLQLSGSNGFIGNGTSNENDGATSFIGDGTNNTIPSAHATSDFIGAGSENYASGTSSFVGAGNDNNAGNTNSAVVAGSTNITGFGATSGFVGAGTGNEVLATEAFVGAGNGNSVTLTGSDSFVGAGEQNTVSSTEAFVGSGLLNSVSSSGTYASILGGSRNSVTAEYATVLGGFGNLASGSYAIVAGDGDTAAGTLSFAAGYHADAAHNGSFVWSDYSSGSAVVKDTAADQFVVRASGGTTVYSNEGATSGVSLAAGSGTWASLSDRNAKADIVPLDDASILAKVSALPVSAWRYKSESGVRHVGPMAQDFYAAFGVGEDNRHITSIDEDGVALAAIKALHRENAELRARFATLETKNAASQHALLRANERLERRLDRLAARMRA
jgi:Chaperone of endosialidase